MGLLDRLFGREPDRTSGSDRVAYTLESPKYHRLRFDGTNRFSGWLFWQGSRTIRGLRALQDDSEVGVFAVDLPRPDIAQLVPHLPGAVRCGFEFDLHIPSTTKTLSFSMQYDDGPFEPFADYDVALAWHHRHEFERMAQALDSVPAPEADLIFLTQGTYDVQEYTDSRIPGVTNFVAYLQRANVDLGAIRSILDFGCGTGRLLAGWWALDPARRLFGSDLNPALIGWAKEHLPKEIDFRTNSFQPPLPYADGAFDLVYLISVFTHLSLASQRRWVEELRRILRPGGLLVATLQGETYVYYVFRDDEEQVRAFHRRGYLEHSIAREGSNEFGTFHTRGVTRELFQGFELRGFFPNSRIDGRRIFFPLAGLHDVYVFRR